jgi:hypothetical protein
MLGDPCHQLPTRGPIDPEEPQLFTGTAKPGKAEARPSGVGHGGRRHDDGHQEPKGSDQQMTLAPFDIFAFVVAAFASQLGGRDALAVEAAGRGMFVAPSLLVYLGQQGVVEALPVPATAPWVEIPVHTGPLRIPMGEHPPFDAPVDDIQERIDDRALTTARFGWRDQP